jgi:hypothetical protein
MFAEELGGNTQRRRQEEARIRRRQLKQQQDKKAQQEKLHPPAGNGTFTTTPGTESSESGISDRQSASGTASATVGSATTDNHASTTLTLGGGATADASGTLLAASTTTAAAPTTKIATTEPANGDSNKKPSAVAIALQQRQLRHQVQHQQKAATTLQSLYRAHRSNTKLLKHQSTLIAQRLKDISQLRVVLKQQEKGEYIPPPALVTSLVQQVLFLNKKLPYAARHRQTRPIQGEKGTKEAPSPSPSSLPPVVSYQFPVPIIKVRDILNDPLKLHLLLQVVILPGLISTDENMNPFVVWIQSSQGIYRLHALLRLCLVMATMPNIDPQVLASIAKFLRGVLLVQTTNASFQEKIVATCRPLLLSLSLPRSRMKGVTNTDSITVLSTSVAARKSLCQQHTQSDVPLDLLQLVRYHLLYATGGPDPIPPEADRCREACIPPKQRAQADALLQLVLDVIHHTPSTSNLRERQNLYLRFVSEVLTIPLLTWKTSATTTSKLLAIDHHHNVRPLHSQQQAPPYQQQPTIVLISMIKTFVDSHGPTLAVGGIESVLAADTPLTVCPATPTQSLLANLILLGRSTPILNGSDAQKLDYTSTSLFFQFVATLVDAIPLGTFSSRESIVEWISDGKGHHSPVVLSTVVMEQCKMLLVDAFVRKLLYCAIDDDLLGTEDTLRQKNDKDVKQETALQEAGTSASTLAAQEARIDRNRSFWNASSWGKKVAKLIAGGESKNTGSSKSKAGGSLINTSSVSRKLAESGNKGREALQNQETEVVGQRATKESYSPELLIALCHVYGIILARWGGGGREDIIRRGKDSGPLMKKDDNGTKQEIAMAKPDMCAQSLLNVLCFSTPVLRSLWGLIQSDGAVISDLYAVIDPTKGNMPVRALDIRPCYVSASGVGTSPTRSNNHIKNVGAAPLFVFVCALVHVLIITDDSEIHDMEKPLPLHQLRRCIQTLKQLLYRACCLDDTSSSDTPGSGSHKKGHASNYFGLALISASSRTMRDLYDRSSRRPFCVPKMWLVEGLMEKDIGRCKSHEDYVALLSSPVLRVCPFFVSFKRRLLLFERIVTTNRVEIQGENSPNPFHTNPLKPGIPIRITRGRILEDGLVTMNNLGRNMRQRLAVQYYNDAGRREDGVDAGGLFKEFWTDLCAIAFDPNYALFRVTEGTLVYNASVSLNDLFTLVL